MTRLLGLAPAIALLLAACLPGPSSSHSLPGSTSASAQVSGQVSTDAIRAHLEALQAIADANGGVRTAGTAGYEASVQYVAEQLRDLGYAVETPEFEMATFTEEPGATIQVSGGPAFAGGRDFRAMIYSGGGEITAPVAAVGFGSDERGGCDASDFTAFPAGAIALTPPGPCFRRQAVLNAIEAGATALVVSFPQRPAGHVLRPTLLEPDGIAIPALAASGAVGDALKAAAEAGDAVRISVRTEVGRAMVHNVIAESGAVADRVVMLGGHLDSVHDGPGINDNGSGNAALLEVARLLVEEHPGERVRLAFWGGEELGLFGSRAYVESLDPDERAEIHAYLNLDMLGSLNPVPTVYASPDAARGSRAITDFLVQYLEEAGIGAERSDIGASSDHAPFDDAGIPTGGIFSGANELKTAAQSADFGGTSDAPMDACYHLACDTVENVNLENVTLFAEAAAAVALALTTGRLSVP
ncbi:MAG: M20/M25/M40 family metallo-hydrolase [Chloroflexota bacterium]|nr:M20/M25/M40 family metallo-hydrolase [Chloroflexota bacterium]